MRNLPVYIMLFLFALSGEASQRLKVITSTSDLKALVGEVAGNEVEVESLLKGPQDPHVVEVRPSYIMKLKRADLLIQIGLGLEANWLPKAVQQAQNSKIETGKGFLEVGPLANPIEPDSKERAHGHGASHAEGNPHVILDPMRATIIADRIAERLGELYPSQKLLFLERASKFKLRIQGKIPDWKNRIKATGIEEVVTYHSGLNYFLSSFEVKNSIVLEPEPGAPPNSKHVLKVLKSMKERNIKLVLVDSYFNPAIANRIKEDLPGVRVASAPTSVEFESRIKSLDDLYERLVSIIENK